MPNDTFFKLDPKKQERVYNSAINEFCRVPYDDVSIKNIVNAASIARGSFYQYFIDKEDLFVYIIKNLNDNGMHLVKHLDIDLFEFIIIYTEKELDILSFDPKDLSDRAKIFKNITKSSIAMMILDREIEKNIKEDPMLVELFKRSNLINLSPSNSDALIDLVSLAIKKTIIQVLNGSKIKEESLAELKRKIEIIKNGIINL